MADNLQNFLLRTRRYVRELDTSTSFWSDLFLTQMFNANYRRRCAALIMAYEGFFTLVATRNIVQGQEAYGFPDGLSRLLKLEIVRTDGTRIPLRRYERHEATNPTNNTQATGDGYFPNFRPFSNGFVLEPTPIETVNDALRLEYTGLPAFLSAPGDQLHPSFPELFDEILVLDTVCSALDAEGLHELGPIPSIKSLKEQWTEDFEQYIQNRIVLRQRIDPTPGPYWDY